MFNVQLLIGCNNISESNTIVTLISNPYGITMQCTHALRHFFAALWALGNYV